MTKDSLSFLQSKIDHLETELSYIQELLVKCGFSEGIQTLKMAAEELIKTLSM